LNQLILRKTLISRLNFRKKDHFHPKNNSFFFLSIKYDETVEKSKKQQQMNFFESKNNKENFVKTLINQSKIFNRLTIG